jgi:hypothetical protein
MFNMERWEIDLAYSMVAQAISKLAERFGFSSFKLAPSRAREAGGADLSDLPPIHEHYDEEIENEEEYCHMLRLCAFVLLDHLVDKSPRFLLRLLSPSVRLVTLTIELCLCADLQEEESREWGLPACRQKVEEGL